MVDVDITIKNKHNLVTEGDFSKFKDENCQISHKSMEDSDIWVMCNGYLAMFLIQKFLFTLLTLSCPVPGGIFTPTFALGAVFG